MICWVIEMLIEDCTVGIGTIDCSSAGVTKHLMSSGCWSCLSILVGDPGTSSPPPAEAAAWLRPRVRPVTGLALLIMEESALELSTNPREAHCPLLKVSPYGRWFGRAVVLLVLAQHVLHRHRVLPGQRLNIHHSLIRGTEVKRSLLRRPSIY